MHRDSNARKINFQSQTKNQKFVQQNHKKKKTKRWIGFKTYGSLFSAVQKAVEIFIGGSLIIDNFVNGTHSN